MSPLKQFCYILALTAMWSPSFLFIKLAIVDLPPLTIVSWRVSLAALLLCSILAWQRQPLPKTWDFWKRTSIMAFFSSSLPFFLFCFAEQSIDSALAAVLNGTTPMFTALFAQFFVASDRMHTQKAIGMALCGAGVILLFAPKLLGGVSATTIGMFAALCAAISYAVSHVYGKLHTGGQAPYVAPAAQFICSAAMLLPLALWHDDMLNLPLPSLSAMGGVLGLAVFGTGIAFIIYYKLMDHCGPTAISMAACFFPVVGMLLGFVFLGEEFTAGGLFAAMMILLGMMIVNGLIVLKPRLGALSKEQAG